MFQLDLIASGYSCQNFEIKLLDLARRPHSFTQERTFSSCAALIYWTSKIPLLAPFLRMH